MDEGDEIQTEEGHCPVISDSKKRPLDADGEDTTSKKSHSAADGLGDGNNHLKILVPGVAAGAIIGKGGETIAQLQKDTGARVKMSKANDFYPGTMERVCLITGSTESILDVFSFIMEKIKEKPDSGGKGADFDKSNGEREKQMKILVPNSTAGMIIGKGGAYIKQIKEQSGAYVQISQKAKDQSLAERCITIIANDHDNLKCACEMILSKVIEDPQRGTCLNISYADINGPVANPNPTGSPFANTPIHGGHGAPSIGANMTPLVNPLTAVSGLGNLLGGGVNLTLNLSSAFASGGAGNALVTGQLLEHVRTQLRSSGFSDHSNAEVCQAIATLINYGIIGLGLGLSGMNSSQSSGAGNALLGNGPDAFHGASGISNGSNGPFGPIGTTVASSGLGLGHALGGPQARYGDRYNSDSFDPFRRQSNSELATSLALNSNSFGLGTALKKANSQNDLESQGTSAEGKNVEVEVGEHIVGAIIGPGGKSLIEIQHVSGTNIQISKKGTYAPGTRNRIVTISGHPSGITTAQFLIEQRIGEEEGKRARQNAILSAIP